MKKFNLRPFLLFSLLTLLLSGCQGKNVQEETSEAADAETENRIYRTVSEIQESGKVNIGVFSDKNPFGYVDENGEYTGYDVYLARRIAEDLGVEAEFISTEAANRVEYLETGKCDIILANFTVTDERKKAVDFALPYMNVSLGAVSHSDYVLSDIEDLGSDDTVIVISGTTAETYLEKNYPDVKLQKFDTYATAKTAFENDPKATWINDNTEVIAFSLENEGYRVGISSFGSMDTIAPAVSKGNDSLLNWINDEITSLGKENFFHKAYEETLLDTYGKEYEDELVIEGGMTDNETNLPVNDEIPFGNGETIRVAASATPHAEILEEARGILEEKGYNLEVVEFEDYVQPNLVVESGEFDANYFQHIPYLESFNEEQGTHLIDAGDIHYEPFGIYPGKKDSLSDLSDGDSIAIPNDTTNEARALLLLQDNGLLKLREGSGLTATVNDITDNPLNLEFVELEAAQVARVVNEVSLVVLNGNYALEAGFSVRKDSIAFESSDSTAAKTYVNIIAVKEGNENDPKIKALISVLRSDAIKNFITDNYDGAVVFFEK